MSRLDVVVQEGTRFSSMYNFRGVTFRDWKYIPTVQGDTRHTPLMSVHEVHKDIHRKEGIADFLEIT